MFRFVLVFLMLVSVPLVSSHAAGQCVVIHAYSDPKVPATPNTKPSKENFGITRTAQGCLEKCMRTRTHRSVEGKQKFRKMQYSCTYNGKLINSTLQTLY